jgi:hypothetical protein
METTITNPSGRFFGRQVLSKLKSGIRNQEQFENLTRDILTSISQQLLLVDDYESRQAAISDYYQQLEKAQLIRQYHMVYENPSNNKKLGAALIHLKYQFKLRFKRYIA